MISVGSRASSSSFPRALASGVYAVILDRRRTCEDVVPFTVRRAPARAGAERRRCCRPSPTSPTRASAMRPRQRESPEPEDRWVAAQPAAQPLRPLRRRLRRLRGVDPPSPDPVASRLPLSSARRSPRPRPGPDPARLPRAPRARRRPAHRPRPARRGRDGAGRAPHGDHRRPSRVRHRGAARRARSARGGGRRARLPRGQRPQRPRLGRSGPPARARAAPQRDPGARLAGAARRAPSRDHRRVLRRLAPAAGDPSIGSSASGCRPSARRRRPPTSGLPMPMRPPRWSSPGSTPTHRSAHEGAILGGAAGFEVDNYDPVLGSPADAAVLASATVGPEYSIWPDDVRDGSGAAPKRRADMVLRRPIGEAGAVFSVGSIAWTGCLVDDDDNPVSRVTENVAAELAREHPFEVGRMPETSRGSRTRSVDVVVVGGGHNGLVAAALSRPGRFEDTGRRAPPDRRRRLHDRGVRPRISRLAGRLRAQPPAARRSGATSRCGPAGSRCSRRLRP